MHEPVTVVVSDMSKAQNSLPYPTIAIDDITPRSFDGIDVILLSPRSPRSRFARKILRWRRFGKIQPRLVLSVSYHGMKFHPTGKHPSPFHRSCDGWIVYSTQDLPRARFDRVYFLPLPISSTREPARVQERVFVGGRQNRDFTLVYDALKGLGIPALFLSDLIPNNLEPTPEITIMRQTVRLEQYESEMAQSEVVAVCLEEANRPHGQLDCARAVRNGIPLLASKGQTCDDYVTDGVNGYLVEDSLEAWASALRRAWEERKKLRAGAREMSFLTSPEEFTSRLNALIHSLLAEKNGHTFSGDE